MILSLCATFRRRIREARDLAVQETWYAVSTVEV